jgi:hypothetical protein
MATLAESLLRASTRPQTGLVDAFQQGQQRGRQANLMGSLAGGAPRGEVLSQLAYVDPMMAGREMGVFKTGAGRETDAQRKVAKREQYAPLLQQIVAFENQIRAQLNNPEYDAVEDFGKLQAMIADYGSKTGEDLKDKLFTIQDQIMKKGEFGMKQGKFGQEKQKIADQDIAKWRTNNIPVANLQKLDNIASFAEEAKLGNPVAIKNLIAATSRLGSNEALSDSELQLMLSGNIGDKFDAVVNRFIGTGTVFSAKDVNSAIRTLNSFAKTNLEKYKKLARGKAVNINKQKPSNYSVEDIQERLFEGIPSDFSVNANASFADIGRDTEAGGTGGAPNEASTTTAPPSGEVSATADLIRRLGN